MINTGKMTRRDLAAIRKTANISTPPCGNAQKLIRELQLVDFSMIDTILYLDAYPHSAEALDYYRKLQEERNKLHAMLAQMGMPITSQSVSPTSGWNWNDAPWPWEIEAN